MSWANSVLPIFTSDSSEKLRIAPDQVQIDTTHLRPQATAKSTLSRTHSPSTGQQYPHHLVPSGSIVWRNSTQVANAVAHAYYRSLGWASAVARSRSGWLRAPSTKLA